MSYRRKHINPKIRNLRIKKKFFKKPLFWIFVLLLLLAGGAFYLFFLFPKFQVQAIHISGNEKIKSQDIEAMAWQDVNKKILGILHANIFIIDSDTLKKDMLAAFPVMEDVKIQKQWPQNIDLKITERKPFAFFCDMPAENNDLPNQKCFYIDKNGLIFEELEAGISVPENMMMIKDLADANNAVIGKSIVDKNTMGIIFKIENNLKNNFQIDVKEVSVGNPLIVKTSESWQVYFDPAQDIDMQITKMNLLLKDQIPEQTRKNLEYIYLQYKDRGYYK